MTRRPSRSRVTSPARSSARRWWLAMLGTPCSSAASSPAVAGRSEPGEDQRPLRADQRRQRRRRRAVGVEALLRDRVADREADVAVVVGPARGRGGRDQRHAARAPVARRRRTAPAARRPPGAACAGSSSASPATRAYGKRSAISSAPAPRASATLTRSTSRSSVPAARCQSGSSAAHARRTAWTYARSQPAGSAATGCQGEAGCPARPAAAIAAARACGSTSATASSASPIVAPGRHDLVRPPAGAVAALARAQRQQRLDVARAAAGRAARRAAPAARRAGRGRSARPPWAAARSPVR